MSNIAQTSNNKINLSKIASIAGVSISTVSRAIRESSVVNPKTKEKILKIAVELGYRPNLLVRGIQTGKTNTIGVMLDPTNCYFGAMIRGIQSKLEEADYVSINISSESSKGLKKQILRLIDRRVDGIIMRIGKEQTDLDFLQEIKRYKVPLITIDLPLNNKRYSYSGSDEYQGGWLAAEHLSKLNHRTLGIIHYQCQEQHSSQRVKGFKDYLEQSPNPHKIIENPLSFDNPIMQANKMLSHSTTPPTAIFVANDSDVPSVYLAVERFNLRIPKDVSIIGFADLPCASNMQPSLTTIKQFPYETGYKAAESLLNTIAQPESHRRVRKHLTPVELVPRDSTSYPPLSRLW